MAELLNEFHATFEWPDELDTPHVSIRGHGGKFMPYPDELLNYRHPHREVIDKYRKEPTNE